MPAPQKKIQKVDIHGWLVIDKEAGKTSADIIRDLKRLLNPKKIGHAGTLDPLATGILPIALGEATKTVSFIVDASKEYVFSVQWGEERTTDDTEGEVTETSPSRPSKSDIKKIMPEFIGEIEQTPPQFSAVKVDGQRAYKLARAGEKVELKSRKVRIDSLEITENDTKKGQTAFHVACGKGTYIRALARDMGRKLGCFGHVTDIRRTRVGPFTQKDAFSLASSGVLSHSARALEALLPVMTALDDIPALAVTEDEARRIKNGQALRLPTSLSGTVRITSQGNLIALAEVSEKQARPLRVFNLNQN